MNVPVAVLRDMGRDGPRQAVFLEPFVLVVEYVSPVATEVFRQVGIKGLGIHLLEGDPVVLTYRSGDLIINSVGVVAVHSFAHSPLKGIRWSSLVGRPTCGTAFRPPSAFHRG